MTKDNYVGIKVDERMRKLIERRAKEEGLNMSEYITHTVLLDSMIEGDIEAMKIIAGNLKEKLRKQALKIVGG